MNFAEINSFIDEAVNFLTGWVTQKQNYEARLTAKDKQITDLTAQLQTATSSLQTDDTQIGALHDKLANLSALIKQQPADPSASDPASQQSNGTTQASTPTATPTAQPATATAAS